MPFKNGSYASLSYLTNYSGYRGAGPHSSQIRYGGGEKLPNVSPTSPGISQVTGGLGLPFTGSVTIGGLKAGIGCGFGNILSAAKKKEGIKRATTIASALNKESTDGCYKNNRIGKAMKDAALLIQAEIDAFQAES